MPLSFIRLVGGWQSVFGSLAWDWDDRDGDGASSICLAFGFWVYCRQLKSMESQMGREASDHCGGKWRGCEDRSVQIESVRCIRR